MLARTRSRTPERQGPEHLFAPGLTGTPPQHLYNRCTPYVGGGCFVRCLSSLEVIHQTVQIRAIFSRRYRRVIRCHIGNIRCNEATFNDIKWVVA